MEPKGGEPEDSRSARYSYVKYFAAIVMSSILLRMILNFNGQMRTVLNLLKHKKQLHKLLCQDFSRNKKRNKIKGLVTVALRGREICVKTFVTRNYGYGFGCYGYAQLMLACYEPCYGERYGGALTTSDVRVKQAHTQEIREKQKNFLKFWVFWLRTAYLQ